MLFLTIYIPLKYLFFKFSSIYKIEDVIVANTVYDVIFFTTFTLLSYKFTSFFKFFLIVLENLFWAYFIYKNISSLPYTCGILLFIVAYRYVFMIAINPLIFSLTLFKEIMFFILIVVLKTKMGEVRIDFFSFAFSAISYYLQFGNFINVIISVSINLFIMFILSKLFFLRENRGCFLPTR